MSRKTGRPSIMMFLVHVVLTIATGGLWLVGMIIWYIMSNKKH